MTGCTPTSSRFPYTGVGGCWTIDTWVHPRKPSPGRTRPTGNGLALGLGTMVPVATICRSADPMGRMTDETSCGGATPVQRTGATRELIVLTKEAWRTMLQGPRNAQVNSKSQVVPSAANVRLVILATGLAALCGCDPVRTIRHSVRMEVMDDHGVPAPNVKVSMKESWESWQTWGGGTPKSEKSYFRQRWENEIPWLRGETDAQGKAIIWIETTGLDWTKGNEPPAKRDFVSNREHIIKLDGQRGQDEIRMVMKPVAAGTGRQYTVRIEAIEKPKYVKGQGEGNEGREE